VIFFAYFLMIKNLESSQTSTANQSMTATPVQSAGGYDASYYTTDISPAEHFYHFVPPHTRGRIAVKIGEARLTKNYGLPGVRMDPYVRLRIGNILFETPTSVNGGKSPSWNRTVNAYLPDDVETVYLEIYDERAFTQDERIAWVHIALPEGIFNNENIDEWYQLSGPQGEAKEGVINLGMSFSTIRPTVQSIQNRAILPFTDADIVELQSMFPNVDKDVVRSVLEAKQGNKEETVTTLITIAN